MKTWTSSAAALAAAVMLTAGAAWAQAAPQAFTYVSGADDASDPAAVAGFMALRGLRREGDVATVQSLLAPVRPSGTPYRYVVATIQFDCKARTGQIASAAFFDAASTLLGEVEESQPPEPLDSNDPADKATIGMACGEIKPGAGNPTFATPAAAITWLEARPTR